MTHPPAPSPPNRRVLRAPAASEGHTGTAVAQHAGQDASVQLVEFHQLQKVSETGLAIIHAKVEAAFIFALWCGQKAGEGAVPGGGAARGASNRPPFLVRGERRSTQWGVRVIRPLATRTQNRSRGATHWQDEVMLDLLQVAQGQNEALRVALALPDQEHTLGRQSSITRDPAWTCPSISLVPRSVSPPSPAPYPSTRPCCAINRWLSSREIRPWNQGWVRWMAGVGGKEMLVIQGRGSPQPQPRLLRVATQPTLGTLDHHPPALRLEPELGVGRLRRWFVFFCSGGRGSQGAIGIHCLPKPFSFLPLHGSPMGAGTPRACPYPPGLCLLHGSIHSFPGVLNDTPSMAREVHGH